MRLLNELLLKLSKRAEKYSLDQLAASFVDVGPLFTLLSNTDNQIVFGRRGTGKTHVLSYLQNHLVSESLCVVKIDMRIMGSSGGIYADHNTAISERATRLLCDTLFSIHEELLNVVRSDESNRYDLSLLAAPLDSLAENLSEVVVTGHVESTTATKKEFSALSEEQAKLRTTFTYASADLSSRRSQISKELSGDARTEFGTERVRIHFGSVNKDIQSIVALLPEKQLWVLIDEWSEVPLELQPFLADLLRRTLFPVAGVTVKVAAIEERCRFRKYLDTGESYIGIEIGADASSSLNLDEFMVFDNNGEQAKDFFGNLLHKHVLSVADDEDVPESKTSFINDVFTQKAAFEEFVRASEGVPRDAINIAELAAQQAGNKQISVPLVREAARAWYNRSKSEAISSRPEAAELLEWIMNIVIGARQAKAFLLSSSEKDALIGQLYDARILHLLKQGVSAQYQPGQRFNVYSLDYGCYVDLITTARAPKSLMSDEDGSGGGIRIDVPPTDFRSIRNSILNLEDFYKKSSVEHE